MLSVLTPHLRLRSVLQLHPDHLRALRLESLLLDLDCTLMEYHAGQIDFPVLQWLELLRVRGIRLCLLSNGRCERIGPLAEKLAIPFVAKAFKPLPFGCHAALKRLGVPAHRAALIGDQLFADVLAGRLAGLFTILVTPLGHREPWFTRIKRPFERCLLRWQKNHELGWYTEGATLPDPEFRSNPSAEVLEPSQVIS